jgi:hypothetical protein
MTKRSKKKKFQAVQAVKEMARERIGPLPRQRVVPNKKKQDKEKPLLDED